MELNFFFNSYYNYRLRTSTVIIYCNYDIGKQKKTSRKLPLQASPLLGVAGSNRKKKSKQSALDVLSFRFVVVFCCYRTARHRTHTLTRYELSKIFALSVASRSRFVHCGDVFFSFPLSASANLLRFFTISVVLFLMHFSEEFSFVQHIYLLIFSTAKGSQNLACFPPSSRFVSHTLSNNHEHEVDCGATKYSHAISNPCQNMRMKTQAA